MDLFDVRAKLAAILAPVSEAEPLVYVDLVDAIDVPCFMLIWQEPWMEASPQVCGGFANPAVIAVAGRIAPGDAYTVLEMMLAQLFRRVRADSEGWGIQNVGSPRTLDVAGVPYLAARVGLRVSVTITAPDWDAYAQAQEKEQQ